MKDNEKKKRRPFMNLLIIPGALVIDALLIVWGTRLDLKLYEGSEELGHAAPAVTIFAVLAAIAITAVAVIVSAILTIRSLRKQKKEQEQSEQIQTVSPKEQEDKPDEKIHS